MKCEIRVYLSYDYTTDHWRAKAFLKQAKRHSKVLIEDVSLAQAIHDMRWQKEARRHIETADLMIVLIGANTHTAPGVRDEISLAGQYNCPVWQIKPHGRNFHSVGDRAYLVPYKWTVINTQFSRLCAR